ncbi:MAG: TonB-dependent receptor plug domain-containing protein [Nitrospinales bacterium]
MKGWLLPMSPGQFWKAEYCYHFGFAFALGFVLAAAPFSAHAQSAVKRENVGAAQKPVLLEPVWVEGSLVPAFAEGAERTALEERRVSPTQKIVVDQKQIERFDDRTIGQVLRRLPGVAFGGPPGENKDLRLRGLDKEYSQVLIDGKRIPGEGEKREFNVNRLPASMIERVEIVRNGVAHFDSQGVAGTVNIVFKGAPDKRIASWSVGGGALEGGNFIGDLDALYGDRLGEFGYLVNVNLQNRNVLKDKTKKTFKAGGKLDKSEIEDETKDFRTVNFSPRFSWNLSSRDVFDFQPVVLLSTEEKDKVKQKFKANGSLDAREIEGEDKDAITWRLRGEWKHKFASTSNFNAGFSIQRIDSYKDKIKREFKGAGALKKTTKEDESKFDREILLWAGGKFVPIKNHFFHVGLQGNIKDRGKNKRKTENGKTKPDPKGNFEVDEDRLSFFVEDGFRWGNHTVLTPGFRVEYTKNATSAKAAAGNGSFTQVNPSFHALRHLTPRDNLRFSVARTVRRPKFDDLAPFTESKGGSITDPDKAGNPNLTVERATGLEMGVEHFFEKRGGVVSVSGFYRRIGNKIEMQTALNPATGRFEEKPININVGKVWGVEFDARRRMGWIGLPGLALSGNVSILDSEVRDPTTGRLRRFKEQPDYVLNGGFDYNIPIWDLVFGMNFNRVGGSDDEVTSLKKQDRLDIFVTKAIFKDIKLRFSARNLLEAEKGKTKRIFKPGGKLDKEEVEVEGSARSFFVSLSRNF